MNIKPSIWAIFLAMTLTLSSVHAAELNAQQAAQARVEIKQLVDGYAIYRDNLDSLSLANLFSEDGVFVFQDKTYQGHDALRKRVDEIDPKTTTMHIMSSGQITIIDDKTATGIHYATIYSKTADAPLKQGETLPVANFAVMGKYYDKYVHTKNGWKIAERSLKSIFSPASNASIH